MSLSLSLHCSWIFSYIFLVCIWVWVSYIITSYIVKFLRQFSSYLCKFAFILQLFKTSLDIFGTHCIMFIVYLCSYKCVCVFSFIFLWKGSQSQYLQFDFSEGIVCLKWEFFCAVSLNFWAHINFNNLCYLCRNIGA